QLFNGSALIVARHLRIGDDVDEENVRDFERDLFLNFGRHLFARTVRRFCAYIKQTSRENGGQRTDQPSVQLVLMLLLMLMLMLVLVIVIVIEINLATNTQRPTPN